MSNEKLNLETIKYVNNKAAIQKAYQGLLDNKPDAESVFYQTIIDFAKSKVTTATFDLPESYTSPDDYAIDVATDVWKQLGSFKGEPKEFYSWLHRICYVTGVDAFREISGEQNSRVPLFVESEDGDMEDNPLLYAGQEIREHARELPSFIQGADLLICKLIREDFTYEEIGQRTGLTESAVTQRVFEMSKKIEALNLPKQRADYLAECDKSWAEAKGPIVRNEDPMVRSGEPYSDWLTWYIGDVDRARAKYGV